MLGRLLIYLMVLIAVVYLFRSSLPKTTAGPADRRRVRHGKMIKCDYCQLYIAEDEAVHAMGENFCSEDHMNRARLDKNP